jgi:hypothetical protein
VWTCACREDAPIGDVSQQQENSRPKSCKQQKSEWKIMGLAQVHWPAPDHSGGDAEHRAKASGDISAQRAPRLGDSTTFRLDVIADPALNLV